MYEDTTQQILLDKLDYEVWLLDFLAKRQDMFEGGTNISLIKITSDEPGLREILALLSIVALAWLNRSWMP